LKKIQRFFEEHVFRKNGERFIMLSASFCIGLISALLLIFELPKLLSDQDAHVKNETYKLLAAFSIFYIPYVPLMRKMIIQYKLKHLNFDKTNWKKGLKGKMKVIGKWFDRGE